MGLSLIPPCHQNDDSMDRLFDKKSKKLPKSALRHTSLGIPTNVITGPLGFRAELDIGPKSEWYRSYRDLEADGPDLTMVSDEKNARASRIVFHGGKSDHQENLTPGTVVSGDGHGNGPTSECSSSSPSLSILYRFTRISTSETNVGDTRKEGEPVGMSRGTCRCQRVVHCFHSTSVSSGERPRWRCA